MLVQDNQQATASWVTGILEGEGHFERYKHTSTIRVSIANTNSCIIEAVEDFLAKNLVLFNTAHYTKKTRGGKLLKVIYISNRNAYSLYMKLLPYLECRRKQFQELVGASETTCGKSLDFQWLIGIWQAEGTFSLSQAGKNALKPRINIVNTNMDIIEKIILNLKAIDCPMYIQNSYTSINKPYKRIVIEGIKRCSVFLDKTNGYWIGKRDILRTSLLREYIDSRYMREPKEPYSKREMEIYHQLKELNV
jgi:hypothetical protein